MEQIEIIDSSYLTSFSIPVTEEIRLNYLLTFLRTHIQNQDLLLNDTSYFYYYFYKTALCYEVIVFDRIQKDSFPEVFLLSVYPKTKKYTVFLLENSFCLFIENELAIFKELEEVNQEDIQNYLLQMYKIEVDEFIKISKEQRDQLIQKFSKESYQQLNKKTFQVFQNRSFIYFILFFLVSTVIFLYVLYNGYIEKEENKYNIESHQLELQKQLILKYKQFEHNKPIKNMIPFFKQFNSLRIKIMKLEFRKNKIFLQLLHPQKEQLLKLTKTKFHMKIKTISYDKTFNSYIMESELVF